MLLSDLIEQTLNRLLMLGPLSLTAPPPHLNLSFKIMFLDFNRDFGPPNGPTVGRENNLPEDTTKEVGGKNSLASVANYPALTFFL